MMKKVVILTTLSLVLVCSLFFTPNTGTTKNNFPKGNNISVMIDNPQG